MVGHIEIQFLAIPIVKPDHSDRLIPPSLDEHVKYGFKGVPTHVRTLWSCWGISQMWMSSREPLEWVYISMSE